MRVSFLGKGGSGKTTMSTSFIKYLERKDKKVFAIDADINVHLEDALNMSAPSLGNAFEELVEYFEPEKVKNNIPVIGTTPASNESKLIEPNFKDTFFKKFAKVKNNLALLTVGTYEEEAVGTACFHEKLGSVVLVYNRLLDNQDMYVVSDMTAGIDAVGTSMFCASDINIFVVEPTKKSIQVLEDFKKVTKKYDMPIYVIANKIECEEDMEFINKNIDKKIILGYVNSSKDLKKFEQGDKKAIDVFEKEIENIHIKIQDIMDNTKRDWDKYYKRNTKIYKQDADEWYSDFYKQDLTKYIDKNFSYEEVINKNGV